jgi:membrane-bound serine protease (ClpP class)
MGMMLIGALALLFLGLGLLVLEVFVPSGGILGVLSGMALLAAVVLAFLCNVWIGIGVLGAVIVIGPMCLATALHFWPRTPFGKKILLTVPTSDEVLPDDPQRRRLKALVGCVGQAKSKMLPSGAVVVEGHTVDAVSEGISIEPGQLVRVVEVRGNRVVVRPLEAEDAAAARPQDYSPDDLARPFDSLGLDPFRDPLA